MLTEKPTPELVRQWKETWGEYHERLKPGRKSGEELAAYLRERYPLTPIDDPRAAETVIRNVLDNACFAKRLPAGTKPSALTWFVRNEGKGALLYREQEEIFRGIEIFVGIEPVTGFFLVEGSGLLWDELFTYRGLDADDLQNPYLVWEYVSGLRRFGQLESALQE